MSKRGAEPTTSSAHIAYKQKKGKKECPGCNQWFGNRHFENHKTKYFRHRNWRCKTSDPQECEVGEYEVLSKNLSTEELHKSPFVSLIRKKIHQKLNSSLNSGDEQSEDEDEEFWHNLTLADIDADFNGQDESASDTYYLNIFSHDAINDDNLKKNTFYLFVCLCIFICTWQSSHVIPDIAVQHLLLFLSDFFNALSAEVVAFAGLASAFPATIYKLYKYVGFQKDNFTKYVVCKKCYKLYKYEDCLIIVEGQQQSKKCNNVIFPNHTQVGRRRPCGEPLLKVVQLQGTKKLYPFKTYCYKSIALTLSSFVRRPDFEEKCEIWRSRRQEPGFLADVFDGNIWKEFQSAEKNNFLKNKQNYGIMLNLDWFQPYEHVQYSVGVMYAVILNLPREERFKIKNVILLGIIPDMKKEPSVQTFIGPLIDELKVGWKEGCDIPATRKLCGFLGHGATLGCSKCYKTFPGDIGHKCYGGFDVNEWPSRNLLEHRHNMNVVKSARTQTERDRLESQFGIRYSPIWELDYFDPIRMSIVDPMHNLYQGTAKKIIKIWLELKILLPEQLIEIQERVDSVNAASNIGSIPRKIASSFGGFTADQWKNWTNIFSIFALIDILPSDDLEVWREFVLASHIITSKFITEPDIRRFEKHILKFCRSFEQLYGTDKVTPNMHLHCHLASCVRDFGPVYSFWLFSFERYNGHLGSLPNNSRAIELQIMRRFTRDAYVNSIELPDNFQELFKKNFLDLNRCTEIGIEVTDQEIRNILYLSRRSAPIPNQDWSNISAYKFSKVSTHCLTAEEYRVLRCTYTIIYPDLAHMVLPESCRKCSSVTLRNEVYGSWESRHKRSSFVMAYWNAEDGQIVEDIGTGDLLPGIVQTYYLHNLIIENESKVHLFAKVNWLAPLPDRYRYHCGKPVEVWSRDIYDVFGPSAFIPVQKIYCKYVRADGKLSEKLVSYICPLNSGMNI
ncbi:unnamed protein product [Mytilus edulis]|uniref:Transposase domain-containing protein n=1 Tax=Mytilus edulis TaxID=6550 RepID=A0A8S3VAB8_MYTED|nr:unnamed protein product [Mytilus edulis]